MPETPEQQKLFDLAPYHRPDDAMEEEHEQLLAVLKDALEDALVADAALLASSLLVSISGAWSGIQAYVAGRNSGLEPRLITEVRTWSGQALAAYGLEGDALDKASNMVANRVWDTYSEGFLYLPKGHERATRDQAIRATFNGKNTVDLCRQHHVTRQRIYQIIHEGRVRRVMKFRRTPWQNVAEALARKTGSEALLRVLVSETKGLQGKTA